MHQEWTMNNENEKGDQNEAESATDHSPVRTAQSSTICKASASVYRKQDLA